MTTFVEYLDKKDIPYTKLGSAISIRDHFFIEEDIDGFPDSVIIERSLIVAKGIKLTGLPITMMVNGFFDLSDTQISELPENLFVKSQLDISNTNITIFPANVKCRSLRMTPENITNVLSCQYGVDDALTLAAVLVNKQICINLHSWLYTPKEFNERVDEIINKNNSDKDDCIALKAKAAKLLEQYVDKFL